MGLSAREPTPRATVITDASFCPNSKASGWAAWVTVNKAHGEVVRIKRSGHFKQQPNNSTQAELWATYNGLWLAYQAGARDILVQTDCLQVVQDGTRSDGYKDAVGRWPEAVVQWRHVKGHNGTEDRRSFVNDWCDKQAKIIMRVERKERGWQPRPRSPHRNRLYRKRQHNRSSRTSTQV